MLKDREDHEIEIAQESNGHILVYGGSGQGKTFFLCRMLEKYYELGKRVLILDYSGSYSEKELKEKNFTYQQQIQRFVLSKRPLIWNFRINDSKIFQKDLGDAVAEGLGCRGYFQKKILGDVVDGIIHDNGKITVPNILKVLEEMFMEEKETEKITGNLDNIGKLLTRLHPFEDIGNLQIVKWEEEFVTKPIIIIELTDFPERQRRFLAELFLSMLWKEVYRQDFPNHCDVLLLDEMQFLSVKEGSTLSSMLREGRKKKLNVVVSTQFISHYDKDEIQALQQAGNMVIFRPTPEDCKRSAKIIDSVEGKSWEKILQGLKKGEAVLKGNYRVDGRSRVSFDPIVVRILESCAENRVKKF